MIDSHIHLSCKCYNQTFPYIDYDGKELTIAADGRREALIEEMKSRGVSCCIEPAIDVDSNELLINLSKESDGFIYPAVGNHPTRCINSKLRDFKRSGNSLREMELLQLVKRGLIITMKEKISIA